MHGVSPDRVTAVANCEYTLTRMVDTINRGEFPTDFATHNTFIGFGQWQGRNPVYAQLSRPGDGPAWYRTPLYLNRGIDIWVEYQRDPERAIAYDADMLAWALSAEAPAGFDQQWPVCRKY